MIGLVTLTGSKITWEMDPGMPVWELCLWSCLRGVFVASGYAFGGYFFYYSHGHKKIQFSCGQGHSLSRGFWTIYNGESESSTNNQALAALFPADCRYHTTSHSHSSCLTPHHHGQHLQLLLSRHFVTAAGTPTKTPLTPSYPLPVLSDVAMLPSCVLQSESFSLYVLWTKSLWEKVPSRPWLLANVNPSHPSRSAFRGSY